MNLLLLTFGDNTDNHQQAVFAALSFMRDPHIRRVLVVTDRPDFYRWLYGTVRNGTHCPPRMGARTLPGSAAWQPSRFFPSRPRP